MLGAIPGDPTRRDFTPFRGEIPENLYVFIINGKAAVRAELAYFSPVKSLSEPAPVCTAVFVKGSIIRHLLHPRLPCLFSLNLPQLRLLQPVPVRPRLERALASVFQDPRCHSV